ncbi:hypothetical protein CR969_00225, partial [Candidatus Saccharibacteria bacterium]
LKEREVAKILAVGGGSGGHVTPVVAVFNQLDQKDQHQLKFWCDRKFSKQAKRIMAKYDPDLPVEVIASGKLRRYHKLGFWAHLAPSVLFPNIRDFFLVCAGLAQSFFKLLAWRPDVIFMKGGYVCLPVGYAAKLLGIPIVLHDSDAHPGLTNRLLAPSAVKIGTGAPLDYYNYPASKAEYVGIPVAADFHQYSDQRRAEFKQQLGFDAERPLVVVTGGGLGAVRINNALVDSLDKLLPETSVFLISGNLQFEELNSRVEQRQGWRIEPFIHEDMYQVLAAADIVVTRAGATTLSELAALHKPTIIVPNGRLTAGHQLKNAKVYQDALAAVVVDENEMVKDPSVLSSKILDLVRASKIRRELGENFAKFAKPDAAKDMSKIIKQVLSKRGKK